MGDLAEYVSPRDSVALDPVHIISQDQLRHAFAHELGHRWEQREMGRVDSILANVLAMGDPERYGYGSRAEHRAEAIAFAVHFLQSTMADPLVRRARPAGALRIPGARYPRHGPLPDSPASLPAPSVPGPLSRSSRLPCLWSNRSSRPAVLCSPGIAMSSIEKFRQEWSHATVQRGVGILPVRRYRGTERAVPGKLRDHRASPATASLTTPLASTTRSGAAAHLGCSSSKPRDRGRGGDYQR